MASREYQNQRYQKTKEQQAKTGLWRQQVQHPACNDMYLASRGIIAARIKDRANWKGKPCRPSLFDYETYTKVRSSVERFFSWLKKSFRRIQIRHDRLAATYRGFLQLGCVMISMRKVSR